MKSQQKKLSNFVGTKYSEIFSSARNVGRNSAAEKEGRRQKGSAGKSIRKNSRISKGKFVTGFHSTEPFQLRK